MKTSVQNSLVDLFSKNAVFEDVPVLVTTLPEEIFNEFKSFQEKCEEIRYSKFSFLREHINEGNNSYQVSVPKNLVEDSFAFAYLIYLGQYYLKKMDNISFEDSVRRIRLRQIEDHFDGYDLWINFSEKGSENPKHTHSGGKGLSGVVYMSECETPTIFDDKITFYGQPGQVVIFPASLYHSVPKQEELGTRVTFAFNLEVINNA